MNTIQLFPEQQLALDGLETVRAVDPRTNTAYVLVREEVYQRMTGLLRDEPLLTSAEMLDRVMADDDADDPTLAYYQRKYGA